MTFSFDIQHNPLGIKIYSVSIEMSDVVIRNDYCHLKQILLS